jgi:hypothetical protein
MDFCRINEANTTGEPRFMGLGGFLDATTMQNMGFLRVFGMDLAKQGKHFGWRNRLSRCRKWSRVPRVSAMWILASWLQFLLLIGFGHAPEVRADAERIRISHSEGSGWILEVKEARLVEVFRVLTEKMGVPVISPPPPDVPLTLRCSGPDVRVILSCLLGSGASVMYRMGLPDHPDGIASARILASSFVRAPARSENADPGRVASILEMTRSEDPEARAEGYTLLGQVGAGNETIKRSAFHQGLSDKSGEVRAAALLGLHGVDPIGSRDALMSGLADADANVRLAALDIMGEGPGSEAVLKQAMNDPDELVRELARMRLGLPEAKTQPE